MTALHHYWLKPKQQQGGPPNTGAVFAWPGFPTKYYTQGTGSVLTTNFPNMIVGKLSSDLWDGGPSDATSCDLVMFRNAAEQSSQSTAVGMFSRGAAWCIESRVGWTAARAASGIVVFPVRWGTGGCWIKYVPSTATLELYVDSVLVQTHTAALIADALHHWAITYSGSTIRVWVDGTLRMTQAATVLPASSTGVVVRYENYGELYVGGVRYWDNEHYTATFTPPTQLTL